MVKLSQNGGGVTRLGPPRRLDAARPQVHDVETSDGVRLRLTRYHGGDRGPVVLLHGFGVSSTIFSTPTIDTNLVEYLCAHGFDVWLLDFRVSIDLPCAASQSTADDVATKDYPAAFAKVRAVTGAREVDVVAHCYGSTTFFMAMLAGLEGVRSVVASQIATHVISPMVTRLKTGARLATLLRVLGFERCTTRPSADAGWAERVYDGALRFYPLPPEDRCDSPDCRRVSFLYGQLYSHEQIGPATHAAFRELFGPANLATFEHLALIVRRGRLTSADGRDAYMGHLDRLALPITFIHGEKNRCFLPVSTSLAMDALAAANGASLYERHVVPRYGHLDCIFGRSAATDVYPLMLRHFERAGA